MKEQQAYEVLGWPHDEEGNDGEDWLAFRCPTPGCQSEGVARSREYGFGRCGRCGGWASFYPFGSSGWEAVSFNLNNRQA